MEDMRIEEICNYLDIALIKINRGELSADEMLGLDLFMDEIQETHSVKRVRVTKNGKATLTLLKHVSQL